MNIDDTTDINKIASGMIHTGIIGGASAITGIMGGSDNLNGTNTAIDAITGGLTGTRSGLKRKGIQNETLFFG